MSVRNLLSAACLFALLGASPALAGQDENLCSFYSKTGGVVVDFMLPLTLREFVDMSTGKNPKLLDDMSDVMLKSMNGADLKALAELSESDGGLMGESAGQSGVELLMSGQATTKKDVIARLNQYCLQVGPHTIIKN